MSARRKRVISTEEIQFNHKPVKMLLTEIDQNSQTPSITGICPYCVQDRPVLERCQTLLHSELTLWWSFPLSRWCPQETSQPRPPHSQHRGGSGRCNPSIYSVGEKLSWFIRLLSEELYIFYTNLWNLPSDIWAKPLEMSDVFRLLCISMA